MTPDFSDNCHFLVGSDEFRTVESAASDADGHGGGRASEAAHSATRHPPLLPAFCADERHEGHRGQPLFGIAAVGPAADEDERLLLPAAADGHD